jgi:hypothetical protein
VHCTHKKRKNGKGREKRKRYGYVDEREGEKLIKQ